MMKNNMWYIVLVLMTVLSSCAVEGPTETSVLTVEQSKMQKSSSGAVEGELLVRFDPRVSEILDKAGVITKSGASAVDRSGVLTVDEILSLVEGYQVERVFPYDKRSESKMREEGLHLWYVVRFSDKYSVEKVASDLAKLGEVSRVEYNRQLKRATNKKATPLDKETIERMLKRNAVASDFNDPYFNLQWNLVNNGNLGDVKFVESADVQIKSAWEKCTGDPSVIVAVLDEGVDITHPDLEVNLWVNEDEVYGSKEDNDGNGYAGDYHGYNFISSSGVITVNDRYDTGHGTHVAGVIAAANNNGIGVSSIAGGNGSEPGVKIMSCQIFAGNYAGTLLDEVRAIKYAADNGAVILQCSWGYISGAANPFDWTPQFSTDEEWEESNVLEKKALDYFVHNAGSPDGVIDGGIVVFAGGNESAPASSYPAAYPDYISVAATAADFTPAVYTNYGPGTTISAPGGDQDYYFEYGEGGKTGRLGCILSTLPFTVEGEDADYPGYGYMEGTSMACPHVSGVLALGISYAAKCKKHFKAEEIKELLLSTVRPIESFWNTNELKYYYKYVTDLSDIHLKSMDLKSYVGKMGDGQVDAGSFLEAIADEGNGIQMTFPNVYLALDGTSTYQPSMYFKKGVIYTVTISDLDVASCEFVGKKLVFKGLKEGQTAAKIVSDSGESYDFIITVRKGADNFGWL